MKKGLRIRVRENCDGSLWDYAIRDTGNRRCLEYAEWYQSKDKAIKAAKAMAKRIGIPYDPNIIKQHGC